MSDADSMSPEASPGGAADGNSGRLVTGVRRVNNAPLLIVLGIATRTGSAFDAALVVALLGFVGTVALARFAERGRVGGD